MELPDYGTALWDHGVRGLCAWNGEMLWVEDHGTHRDVGIETYARFTDDGDAEPYVVVVRTWQPAATIAVLRQVSHQLDYRATPEPNVTVLPDGRTYRALIGCLFSVPPELARTPRH